MAELLCFGSGSSGNSYAIKCESETLLIELGLPWKDIISGLNFDITNVVGSLISHVHSDHANKETIRKALQYGIPVYSNEETRNIDKRIKNIKKGAKTQVGGFEIQPIPLFHNCMNFGFVIEHEEMGKLVFCTDTCRIPYRFKNVQHFMVESNYSYDLLIDHMVDDVYSQSASENHMEINDTIAFLKENYNENLQTIVLLHLSNGNSNASEFVKKTKEELSFNNVFIAEKNFVLPLCKEEF